MWPEQRLISRLLLVVLSTPAFSNLAAPLPPAKAGTYDYLAPQVAPPVAANLGMAEIAAILNETAPNPPYFVAYQLTTTDTNNNLAGAAPLKVVPTDDAQHSYLGVFHNQINSMQFATYLGYSGDLRVWHTIGQIHS